ncbi:MAG: hypothetical protein ACKOS8_15050 [Gemmataceae bacterium]
MLGLLGFILFVLLALAVAIFFIGSVLQTRLFDQAPEGLFWRAPAAAGLVTFPLILWAFWTLASPGDTRPLQQAPKSAQTNAFSRLQVLTLDDRVETYTLIPGGNPSVPRYRNIEDASRPIPTVMKEVRVPLEPESKEFQVVFKHEKTAGQTKESYVNDSGRYVDDEGRVMERGTLGVLIQSRTGKFLVLLVMYGLLFTAWVASMLVLMQLPGGYGISVGLAGALLTNFTLVPFLVALAEKASGK